MALLTSASLVVYAVASSLEGVVGLLLHDTLTRYIGTVNMSSGRPANLGYRCPGGPRPQTYLNWEVVGAEAQVVPSTERGMLRPQMHFHVLEEVMILKGHK